MGQLAGHPNKSIALIGLMGSGKSTLGRQLARRLERPFFDTDEAVEAAAQLTINDIFERFGEAHFRQLEREVLASLMGEPAKVIATGGGAFADEVSRHLLLERTVTVWLDVDLDAILDRVGNDDARPLLRGREPRAALTELARSRKPLYEQAHLRVGDSGLTLDAVVDRLAAALSERGG